MYTVNNATNNAKQLLMQQQINHTIRSTNDQVLPRMSEMRAPSTIGRPRIHPKKPQNGKVVMEVDEFQRLTLDVCNTIPVEMRAIIEFANDFVLMGSPILAQAYLSQTVQYLEKAKSALVQNMSVAGSVVDFNTHANSTNIVQPWINQNHTYLRTTAPSECGVSSAISNRSYRPNMMSFAGSNASRMGPPELMGPPSSTSFRRPNQMPPPKRKQLPPLQSINENGVLPNNIKKPIRQVSSDRLIGNKIVRSTPLRRDARSGYSRVEDEENIFPSNMSPLSLRPEREFPVEDLLTTNSPSRRQYTKPRQMKKVVRSAPSSGVNSSDKDQADESDLNLTITRGGRVSKPPKKFSFTQYNGSIIIRETPQRDVLLPSLSPSSSSSMERTQTLGKKRKLLPICTDEPQVKIARKTNNKAVATSSRVPSLSEDDTIHKSNQEEQQVNKNSSSTGKKQQSVATNKKVEQQKPSLSKKQPTVTEDIEEYEQPSTSKKQQQISSSNKKQQTSSANKKQQTSSANKKQTTSANKKQTTSANKKQRAATNSITEKIQDQVSTSKKQQQTSTNKKQQQTSSTSKKQRTNSNDVEQEPSTSNKQNPFTKNKEKQQQKEPVTSSTSPNRTKTIGQNKSQISKGGPPPINFNISFRSIPDDSGSESE